MAEDKIVRIIRVVKTNNFTTKLNEVVRRDDLTLAAKGLHDYFMSLPNDWEIHFSELSRHFADGIYKVRKAFKELEAAGYVKIQMERKGGKIAKWNKVVYETCQKTLVNEPDRNFQHVEKQHVETQHVVDCTLLNTDLEPKTNVTKNIAPIGAPNGEIVQTESLPESRPETIGSRLWKWIYDYRKKTGTLPVGKGKCAYFYKAAKDTCDEIVKQHGEEVAIKAIRCALADKYWSKQPLDPVNFDRYMALLVGDRVREEANLAECVEVLKAARENDPTAPWTQEEIDALPDESKKIYQDNFGDGWQEKLLKGERL